MTLRSILPAPLRTPRRLATPLRRGAPLVATVLAWIATLSLAASALAQGVPRLGAQVTDETGVLGGASSVASALNDLLGSRDVQLWIAFVHTTGNQTPSDFAQATFTQNGLGGNDALLVVAVDDHRYAWWEADNGPLRGIRDEVDGI
ncbi:MAG TPA: TPM domain-containing protein, partial [Candidatus Limnocylindrales bacterium]